MVDMVKLGAAAVGAIIGFAILVGVIDGIGTANRTTLEITLLGLVGAVFLAVLILGLLKAIS